MEKKFDRYFGTLHLSLEIPFHLYNIDYFQGRVAREQLWERDISFETVKILNPVKCLTIQMFNYFLTPHKPLFKNKDILNSEKYLDFMFTESIKLFSIIL